jgi:hypothetical protein
MAFSNVEVVVDAVNLSADCAAAEWHAALDFTGPLVLDDDEGTRIEPTGQRLELAGASFVEFDGERVRAFRHYFDDLALLEQPTSRDQRRPRLSRRRARRG